MSHLMIARAVIEVDGMKVFLTRQRGWEQFEEIVVCPKTYETLGYEPVWREYDGYDSTFVRSTPKLMDIIDCDESVGIHGRIQEPVRYSIAKVIRKLSDSGVTLGSVSLRLRLDDQFHSVKLEMKTLFAEKTVWGVVRSDEALITTLAQHLGITSRLVSRHGYRKDPEKDLLLIRADNLPEALNQLIEGLEGPYAIEVWFDI